MEDLLEKFYGKPESEGSAGAPGPDESAPQPEPEPQPQHNQQLEQRVGRVETQLLQIAKAQQTILSRLDTMIEQQESQQTPPPAPKQQQEPPPVPKQAWRPAWKEPRPEPQPEPQYEWPPLPPISHPEPDESIGDGEGTPLTWDPVNKTLHSMDDASEDAPSVKGHSSEKSTRTCTICGRQFPMHRGKTSRATQHGPETLHCPKCYSANQTARTTRIAIVAAILGVLGVILLIDALANV